MNFMFSWQEQYLTLFMPLEHKIQIFSLPCNILYVFSYFRKILENQVFRLYLRNLCCLLYITHNLSEDTASSQVRRTFNRQAEDLDLKDLPEIRI